MPVGSFSSWGIAAPSPLSGPSRRYSLPLVRLVRHVQWFASSQNDGATSPKPRAHKIRGGCGRIRTLHPSSPPIGLCISMHVPMVRMSGRLSHVSLVSPTCMDIYPDDTQEPPLSTVIYNPHGPVYTRARKLSNLLPLVIEKRRQDRHVSLSPLLPAPPASRFSTIRHLPTPL